MQTFICLLSLGYFIRSTVCMVSSSIYVHVSVPCPLCCVFVFLQLNTSLREPAIFSFLPCSFLSYVCADFFSASATCVVAMFLCLYISEHLLFQQGPHGLKCQSKQLPDKCIVQQACVSPPPIPPLLVL